MLKREFPMPDYEFAGKELQLALLYYQYKDMEDKNKGDHAEIVKLSAIFAERANANGALTKGFRVRIRDESDDIGCVVVSDSAHLWRKHWRQDAKYKVYPFLEADKEGDSYNHSVLVKENGDIYEVLEDHQLPPKEDRQYPSQGRYSSRHWNYVPKEDIPVLEEAYIPANKTLIRFEDGIDRYREMPVVNLSSRKNKVFVACFTAFSPSGYEYLDYYFAGVDSFFAGENYIKYDGSNLMNHQIKDYFQKRFNRFSLARFARIGMEKALKG